MPIVLRSLGANTGSVKSWEWGGGGYTSQAPGSTDPANDVALEKGSM